MKHFLLVQVEEGKYREIFPQNIRAWTKECLELSNKMTELTMESRKWMIEEYKRTKIRKP